MTTENYYEAAARVCDERREELSKQTGVGHAWTGTEWEAGFSSACAVLAIAIRGLPAPLVDADALKNLHRMLEAALVEKDNRGFEIVRLRDEVDGLKAQLADYKIKRVRVLNAAEQETSMDFSTAENDETYDEGYLKL